MKEKVPLSILSIVTPMIKIMRAATNSKIPDIYENMELLLADGETFPELFGLGPKVCSPPKPNREEATTSIGH